MNNYRAFGAEGLLLKRRGKPSNRAYPQALREHAMALVHAYYRDLAPTLAAEKLLERHELFVFVAVIRRWMTYGQRVKSVLRPYISHDIVEKVW